MSKLLKIPAGAGGSFSFRLHVPKEHIEVLGWSEKTVLEVFSFPKCRVMQVKEVLK